MGSPPCFCLIFVSTAEVTLAMAELLSLNCCCYLAAHIVSHMSVTGLVAYPMLAFFFVLSSFLHHIRPNICALKKALKSFAYKQIEIYPSDTLKLQLLPVTSL